MVKITKANAARFLAKAPEDKLFRCNDSCLMSDMKELAQALNGMSDETFSYHANEAKNDFANWVADVMGDQELASALRKAKNRTRAAKLVSERVAFLSKRAA